METSAIFGKTFLLTFYVTTFDQIFLPKSTLIRLTYNNLDLANLLLLKTIELAFKTIERISGKLSRRETRFEKHFPLCDQIDQFFSQNNSNLVSLFWIMT
jgi:hypothetical protein